MENLEFFSEGFWACIGALIGALVGGVITYFISRQAQKFDLKKQKIFYLDKLFKETQIVYAFLLDLQISNNIQDDHVDNYRKVSKIIPIIKSHSYLFKETEISNVLAETNRLSILINDKREQSEVPMDIQAEQNRIHYDIPSYYSSIIEIFLSKLRDIRTSLNTLHEV